MSSLPSTLARIVPVGVSALLASTVLAGCGNLSVTTSPPTPSTSTASVSTAASSLSASATPSDSGSAAMASTPAPTSTSSNSSGGDVAAVVAETTAGMSAPLPGAYRVGTYDRGQQVKLYCHRAGMVPSDLGTTTDSWWYNTSDGYWIADAALQRTGGAPYAPLCGSPDTDAASASDLKQFVDDRIGRSLLSWNNTSKGQCVTISEAFFNSLYGLVLTGQTDAYTYAPGRLAGNQISEAGFSWHTDRNFKDGDIIVMDRDAKMTYGHVAMYYQGKLFESNVNGRMTAGLDPVYLPNYLGYWRG